MKLSSEELEKRLSALGFDRAKVQRIDDSSIEKQAEGSFVKRPETAFATGIAMSLSGLGMAFSSPPLLGIGLLAVGGALLGYGLSRQRRQHVDYLDRSEALRQKRSQIKQDTARAQELIRAALPRDSADDERLIAAFDDKVLQVDMPGMMEALEKRLQHRHREENEEGYSGTEWDKSIEHSRNLRKAKQWADQQDSASPQATPPNPTPEEGAQKPRGNIASFNAAKARLG